MAIYFLLAFVLLLLLFIAFKLQGKPQDDGISQHIKLAVSEGIREVKEELNKNNVAQVKEIGDIKKSINDELHRFKQAPESKRWLHFFLWINFSLIIYIAAVAADLWSVYLIPWFTR